MMLQQQTMGYWIVLCSSWVCNEKVVLNDKSIGHEPMTRYDAEDSARGLGFGKRSCRACEIREVRKAISQFY